MRPKTKRKNNTGHLGYSIPSAAETLDVGRSSIYALIKVGKLKALKIGSRRIVTGESMAALLAEAK